MKNSTRAQRTPGWKTLLCAGALLVASADPSLATVNDVGPSSAEAQLSSSDRANLREAIGAALHAIREAGAGHEALNPGQRWVTSFDKSGFQIAPSAGGWTFGLELEGYGFAGCESRVTTPAQVDVDGGRLVYRWDDSLEEWYVNDRRGLEHGFSVRERPARASADDAAALRFELRLRGALRPELTEDGRGVLLRDEAGGVALSYSGLTAFDAEGTDLPASIELAGDRLSISVDERGARYPLTIDPIAQQAYLKASNTDAEDLFGCTVAVSGDTAVVGAKYEDSNSVGVNGLQHINFQWSAGAAYVFVRTGSTWKQEAYLKASNTNKGDRFGTAVAISGDTIVVGAEGEESNATGVDGNQLDNTQLNAGAAYVFFRNGTTWAQEAYLKASDVDGSDYFGSAVDVSGDTIIVGAWGEDSHATGVNGDDSGELTWNSGAAYVFVRNGTTWTHEAYLKASNTERFDRFGHAVSISGDTVVVGAYQESSDATGVNGDDASNAAPNSGAAFVFVREGSTWSQEAYLKASNTDAEDGFGRAVSISGDTVVVGAQWEDSWATGVDGDQGDDSALSAGAGYVFERVGTTWAQSAYLKASNTDPNDGFGVSVAASGDRLVVGAPWEDSAATGVDGDQFDNSLSRSGAAYVFERSGPSWAQVAYLKASNPDADDTCFRFLDLSGGTLIAGAQEEDGISTDPYGNQADDSASNAGAAYVFDLDAAAPPGTPFCFGDGSGTPCPCSFGEPGAGCGNSVTVGATLTATGQASFADDTFGIVVTGVPPLKIGLCLKGSNQLGGGGGIVVGDGLLCSNGDLRSQVLYAGASGAVVMDSWRGMPFGTYPGAANAGASTYYQWWYRDPQSTCSDSRFNFSNSWRASWN